MSGKTFGLASLVAVVLGLGSVRGQGVNYLPPDTPSARAEAPGIGPVAPSPPRDLTPSRWILYDREPGCCGPTGRNGPLGYEAYFRTGLAFPLGGGGLNSTLGTGWDIEIGARTLLFNPAADAAWTLDVGLSNVWYHVNDQARHSSSCSTCP